MLRRFSLPREPHHTLQNPVFIQKIVPFAATRVENGAVFSSVSSSWQETMCDHGGAVLCWKAFYDLSVAAQQTVREVFENSCQHSVYCNAHIRRELFGMLSLVPPEQAKSFLETKYAGETPFLHTLANQYVIVDDIRLFFELCLNLGSENYLQARVEQDRSIHVALANRNMPLDMLEYFLTTVKSTFGREFLRALLDGPRNSVLSFAVESGQASISKIRLLLDTFKDVGGDAYLREQLDKFSISAMAVLCTFSLEGCQLICSLKREMSGDADLRDFLRLRIPSNYERYRTCEDRLETLLLCICSHEQSPFLYRLSEKEKLDRVQFLFDLFLEIGGSAYLKEQLEARKRFDSEFSTSFQEACKSKTSDLLIYFVSFMKKHCGVEYLKRALAEQRRKDFSGIKQCDFTSAFKNAIACFSRGRESASSSHNVELLASVLSHLGLFTEQFNALSDRDRAVLGDVGINASFKYASSFDEWFGMKDELSGLQRKFDNQYNELRKKDNELRELRRQNEELKKQLKNYNNYQ